MRLGIEVPDGDGEQLRSLQRWLLRDPDTADATFDLRGRHEQPGAMGGGLELIDVVLSNSVGLGGLILAVANWRQSRANAPSVQVEHEGVTVTVEGADLRQIERLVDRLIGQGPEPHVDTPERAELDQSQA
ncbi:hypothetical protein GCM10022403_073820 [Streptomyces coacervatus]|uniref:Uncharacterized protein n=1 Tax=Streptomyces coacervatus TaxID=647381 RepID=A0ABP7IYG1_9ACTN|nr:hypothetical protein [Streptomyces coacervatus]MDF2270179.1 hypothetical protein [Streptomyces coacervatus]